MVVFRTLRKKELLSIVDLMMDEVVERLREKDINIYVSPEAKDLILEKGFDPKFGARPLRRAIQQMVEDRLADMILDGTLNEGIKVNVNTRGEQLDISKDGVKP
jgi:ATP-dependent Clp protease ATP-binding subunit ClpC